MNTPQEFHELIHAIVEVLDGFQKAKEDDGQVSKWEMLAILLHKRNDLRAGVAGISRIPEELKELDEEGLQILKADVIVALQRLGYSHLLQDRADAVMTVALSVRQAWNLFVNAPPVALPA